MLPLDSSLRLTHALGKIPGLLFAFDSPGSLTNPLAAHSRFRFLSHLDFSLSLYLSFSLFLSLSCSLYPCVSLPRADSSLWPIVFFPLLARSFHSRVSYAWCAKLAALGIRVLHSTWHDIVHEAAPPRPRTLSRLSCLISPRIEKVPSASRTQAPSVTLRLPIVIPDVDHI